MKGTNRYSKSTTKKAIDTEKDPYLVGMEVVGNAYCKGCGAYYHNKRWSMVGAESKRDKDVKEVTCPACRKIKDGYAGGYVTLKGEFIRDHSVEIINLVRNNEKRAMHNNPLDRIIAISRLSGEIEIKTTTDKFAQRLGRILKKSYKGCVEYKWSDGVRVARVVWSR